MNKYYTYLIAGFLLICTSLNVVAQERKYSTFYYQRSTLFEQLPITNSDIIFLGNSITNGAEWFELFQDSRVKNRGISGDTYMGVYDRLDPILKGHPAKIFLLIGINDVSAGRSSQEIVEGIGSIINKIKKDSPETEVYVQSLLPVNSDLGMFQSHTTKPEIVNEINKSLLDKSEEWKVTYINLYPHFIDSETGKMSLEFSNDGLHLLGPGYLLWAQLIKKYL